MLVLTRRQGESITIGEDIKLMVIRVDANHIKLGIEAPQNLNIVRDEIKED